MGGRGEADDGVLDVIARDHSFVLEHAAVRSGPTDLRLRNDGAEAHQMQIGRLRRPMSVEEFVEMFERRGDRATVEALDWVGGVGVVEPGGTGTASAQLSEGDYMVVCYVPAPDGTSHVMLGMVAALHVAGQVAAAGSLPPASESILLEDYRIVVPDGFRGDGEVSFVNDGSEPHEVVLLRLDDGRTLADAAAYQADPRGDRPFEFAGGVGSIGAGRSATARLDLEPGDYIATCFVPGRDGTPHIDLGMLTTFSIE